MPIILLKHTPPPWTPTDSADLEYWGVYKDGTHLLDSGGSPVALSASVYRLGDGSGNGYVFEQATAGNRGTRTSAGIAVSTDDYYDRTGSSLSLPAFTIAGVITPSAFSAAMYLWGDPASNDHGVFLDTSGRFNLRISDVNTAVTDFSLTAGVQTAFVLRYNGSTFYAETVSASGSVTASGSASATGTPVLGRRFARGPAVSLQYDGEEAASLAFSAVLSGYALSGLRQYLGSLLSVPPTFDSTLVTFDSTAYTFDQTT